MKRNYPKVWGRGALFTFSGIEGVNTLADGICGRLLGDHLGISVDEGAIELYLRLKEMCNFQFTIVASDIVLGKLNGVEEFGFLLPTQNTILGFCPKKQMAVCCNKELSEEKCVGDFRFFFKEEVVYAFSACEKEEYVFFALSKNGDKEVAEDSVKQALHLDLDWHIHKKLAFFDQVPYVEALSEAQNMTLAKSYSVMKSQVYTAEGLFRQRWTTPDRWPHKFLWLWDSVFHSIGNAYIEPELAYDSICSIFDAQREDGFIPHMATPNEISDVTQPPVIAWGMYRLYEKVGKKEWLEEHYEQLEAYLAWDLNHRDANKNGLMEWLVETENPSCRCAESGMDNSPRFDDVVSMDAIDFSCFMANEVRHMAKISDILGKAEKKKYYEELFTYIKEAINRELFDEEDGRYYDRELSSGKLRKVSAVSSFLPLFSGVCTPERAKRLVEDIFDPNTFGTAVGVPSISAQDKTFGEDMWRGPVWINYNYLIISGLLEYVYKEEAERLMKSTLSVMTEWYQKEGSLFEFYDCDNKVSPPDLSRKGPALRPAVDNTKMASIRDYGWTAAVFCALVMEWYGA